MRAKIRRKQCFIVVQTKLWLFLCTRPFNYLTTILLYTTVPICFVMTRVRPAVFTVVVTIKHNFFFVGINHALPLNNVHWFELIENKSVMRTPGGKKKTIGVRTFCTSKWSAITISPYRCDENNNNNTRIRVYNIIVYDNIHQNPFVLVAAASRCRRSQNCVICHAMRLP